MRCSRARADVQRSCDRRGEAWPQSVAPGSLWQAFRTLQLEPGIVVGDWGERRRSLSRKSRRSCTWPAKTKIGIVSMATLVVLCYSRNDERRCGEDRRRARPHARYRSHIAARKPQTEFRATRSKAFTCVANG